MDTRYVISSLDKAIAKVGSELLYSAMVSPPCNTMSQDEQRQFVLTRSEALRTALGSLVMPNYDDDTTAAAYLFIYQASHIGLAWAMINEMLRQRPSKELLTTGSRQLQIIDFGCGALAMQFGVAMAVAEAIENGEEFEAITVDGIDTSPTMQRIGMMLWREFVDVVGSDARLASLSRACQLISFNPHHDYCSVQKVDAAECWISAMHAVYQSNSAAVRRAFNHFHQNFKPTAVLATCWGREGMTTNTDIVRGAWSSAYNEFNYHEIYLPTNQQYDIEYPFNNTEPAASNMNQVAYQRGIIPSQWNLFWRVADAVILTWTVTEAEQERREALRRASAREEMRQIREQERQRLEQERRREARRQRDRERRQRQREEQAKQRQEEERQRRERERQQQRQEEARRHSGQRPPSPEAERLRERQRRAEEIQRRDAQERARQRQQQEEARRHSDRVEHQGQQERWRKIQEEARQRSEQERQQRRQEGEAQRHSSRGIPGKIRSGLSLLLRRRRK